MLTTLVGMTVVLLAVWLRWEWTHPMMEKPDPELDALIAARLSAPPLKVIPAPPVLSVERPTWINAWRVAEVIADPECKDMATLPWRVLGRNWKAERLDFMAAVLGEPLMSEDRQTMEGFVQFRTPLNRVWDDMSATHKLLLTILWESLENGDFGGGVTIGETVTFRDDADDCRGAA